MTKPVATPPPPVPPPTAATRIFVRLFGKAGHRSVERHPMLDLKLQRARNPLVPSAYLAALYGHVTLAVLVGLLPLVLYVVLTAGAVNINLAVPLAALPAIMGLMTYSYDLLKPDLQIAARKRNLETNLPYALNFMASMASAGVIPIEIFGALAAQPVYGEAAREAAWIHRDAKMFSKDLVTALQAASRRSPSQQFEEFLQGAVNTMTSGGDLKTYLLGKSEQFTQENRRKQKAFLESMGVMAESYVVVAAAAPLFLIVILSVMLLLTEGGDPTFFLNILILLALPLLHVSFTYILRSMRPD
ncbi:MAG TPA: type II secretion system F family protein [Candidatus Thermoplasmatota archaeon]|nr:type II secretion system F family protein [Candidatus Thermoplasmatota archaeon]